MQVMLSGGMASDPANLLRQKGAPGEAAALLRILANETRLMVLCRLGRDERTVSDLQEALDLQQPTLSQHLAVLREADIVATRRSGQKIFYHIENPAVLDIIATLGCIFCPEDKP